MDKISNTPNFEENGSNSVEDRDDFKKIPEKKYQKSENRSLKVRSFPTQQTLSRIKNFILKIFRRKTNTRKEVKE
jgi:hypothetical protein